MSSIRPQSVAAMSDKVGRKAGRSSFYPSKLFSLGDHYLPENIKEIFAMCKYLALTDPVISGAIHKMSEAPITDLVYDHPDAEVRDRWKELLEKHIKFRERMLEGGFDVGTYSNAFFSPEVPVTRYLMSPEIHPDLEQDVRAMRDYEQGNAQGMSTEMFDLKYKSVAGMRTLNLPRRWRIDRIRWTQEGGKFKGVCPLTEKEVLFERIDRYYASASNVRLKKWDPNRIEIWHDEINDANRYFYQTSDATRELLRLGDRDLLQSVPWEYVEAAMENRNVEIRTGQLYHISNAKISGAFNGWGIPRLYAAFKLIYYYMTLLRSNEATAIGKINDLNILFPQTQTGAMDPSSFAPGGEFVGKIMGMVAAHKQDPNFVGVAPIPVGVTSVFGQGRMNLITSEMEPVIRLICVALGVPYEILFGGGAYSGSAVSQRVFTTQTGLHRERFNEMLDFFVQRFSALLGKDRYPADIQIRLKEVEGPDDVQKKASRMQAALSNRVSIRTMHEDMGLDPEREMKYMEQELPLLNKLEIIRAKGMGAAQAEQQEIMTRSQQQMMEAAQPPAPVAPAPIMAPAGEPMPAEGASPEVTARAEELMGYIESHPEMEAEIMAYAEKSEPEVFELLRQAAEGMAAPQGGMPYADVDPADYDEQSSLTPPKDLQQLPPQQPEQRPPRRASGGV